MARSHLMAAKKAIEAKDWDLAEQIAKTCAALTRATGCARSRSRELNQSQ